MSASSNAVNMLPNASFEEADRPLGWEQKAWAGSGEFACDGPGRNGGRCVRISSPSGGDLNWFRNIEVKPYATYRLAGWIKTENVVPQNGKGAFLGVRGIAGAVTAPVVGTKDWTRVEAVIDVNAQDGLNVNCVLGGEGLASGTAWFDDLSVELVSARDLKPAAVLNADKVGAPISKYIYGQFIEHLGRCIYGGIWAEMLEDRKFYFPVEALESPWRTVGEPGDVGMIEKDPFVGLHTPQVALRGDKIARGIMQAGLGLVGGKEYEGSVIVAGDASTGPVEVSLVWGDAPDARQTVRIDTVTGKYVKHAVRFTAGADSDNARLEIAGLGKGSLRIGTASLMPADNVHGMRKDTLALLKELNSPVYRWPGGNFVSGYNWKDGIGDRDTRPPRKNPAWKGIEHNDFGIDEFMTLCREIDAEPYIAVNSGHGDAKLAADEVEYANGAANTPMGKLRAKNGHPEPYGVPWWSIGNEMYGGWQIGHMPIEKYVKKHNDFADAMRAVDPSIKLVAVGATGPWSEAMLAQCADHMDLLSEHFYCHAKPGLLSHVRQIPDAVREKAERQREYCRTIPALSGKCIPIALDEWNYWYGPDIFGEIGTRYFLKDALGIAAGLHEYARNSDLFVMANYAQTVNVIGAIKTNKTAAAFDTTGLALKLYRNHYGTLPIEVAGDTRPLDVAAAWREDRKAITVAVVNPTRDAHELKIEIQGAGFAEGGRRWCINGSDPMAFNDPSNPNVVRIEESAVSGTPNSLSIPEISVCLFELPVR